MSLLASRILLEFAADHRLTVVDPCSDGDDYEIYHADAMTIRKLYTVVYDNTCPSVHKAIELYKTLNDLTNQGHLTRWDIMNSSGKVTRSFYKLTNSLREGNDEN